MVEINDDRRGTYNTNSQIKFKTAMIKSTFCEYSDAYILVGWTGRERGVATIAGPGAEAAAKKAVEQNKKVISKNYTP